MLPAGGDAEFGALFDGVDGVAAGVSEPDDIGLRSLRLQQEEPILRDDANKAQSCVRDRHRFVGLALRRIH